MNKDQPSLQRIEGGKSNPTLFYLLEVAEALEIPIEELVKFKVKQSRK